MTDALEALEHKPMHKMVKIIIVLTKALLYLPKNSQNAVLRLSQPSFFSLNKDEWSIQKSKVPNKTIF